MPSDLREQLNAAASTHCPRNTDDVCNFCTRDRRSAYRFARLALESLPCLLMEAYREPCRPGDVPCSRCAALASISDDPGVSRG